MPPAELEDLLLAHPGIRDVAVIGFPDEVSGEVPHAFVIPHDGVKLTEADVVNFMSGTLLLSLWMVFVIGLGSFWVLNLCIKFPTSMTTDLQVEYRFDCRNRSRILLRI